MYAIIAAGGKQYKITEGESLRLEKLEGDLGSAYLFDQVLMVNGDTGLKIGTPIVNGAKVEAEIVYHGKGKKVIVYKSKKRKGFRKKFGHRQEYTEVKIKRIVI